jgi:MFS family permease
MLIAAFQAVVVTATVYFESIYMQQIFGYSALRTGLDSLPLPVGVAVGANMTARVLLHRFSPRQVATGGLAVLATALAYFARIPDHGSYVVNLVLPLFLLGLGLGAASVCMITIVTSKVDSEHQGVVAGIYNMSQQLGGAAGLAALVTVASTVSGSSHPPLGNEADGIRVAFLISAIIAAAGTMLARTYLPTGPSVRPEVANIEAVDPLPLIEG